MFKQIIPSSLNFLVFFEVFPKESPWHMNILLLKKLMVKSNFKYQLGGGKDDNEIHVRKVETFHLHLTCQEKNLGMLLTVGLNVVSSSAIVMFSTAF